MYDLTGHSLEMTAKERDGLDEAAPLIAPGTQIAVAFLPNEDMDSRIAAARHIRELGFEPMPHLSARRIASRDELVRMVERVAAEAGVTRMFLVAGDPPEPAGPFEDVLSMLRTGVFEANGIRSVGIAGHPEGHPAMDRAELDHFMDLKIADIAARGMDARLVTQFSFDAEALSSWLARQRARGIDIPVRLGVPGPAGIKRLLRYAAFCGVASSASVLRKYGISITRLMGSTGPDRLMDELMPAIAGDAMQPVHLHFYPFGGLAATARWIAENGGAIPASATITGAGR